MKIIAVHTKAVGPVDDGEISLLNTWTQQPETKVLLTGPNGCGKSTLLRAVAMLWQAAGYWLDRRANLPTEHDAYGWLSQWGGVAVIFDRIEPFSDRPFGLYWGEVDWVEQLLADHTDVQWLGEKTTKQKVENEYLHVAHMTLEGKEDRTGLQLPDELWFEDWAEQRTKLIVSHEKADGPNLTHMDAEERVWVKATKGVSTPVADDLAQRWLTKHIASEQWQGQLEPSLIALKSTQLHRFHKILRDMNSFFSDKEISKDIVPGEGRLRVKVKRKGWHYIDELSSGERQVLILIYNVSRWLQPGGIVMIDEPDLYLHPSLITSLLSSLERMVQENDGQLVITSHAVDVWRRYENQGMRIELNDRD